MNKYIIQPNSKRADHDWQVEYNYLKEENKVMLNNIAT